MFRVTGASKAMVSGTPYICHIQSTEQQVAGVLGTYLSMIE